VFYKNAILTVTTWILGRTDRAEAVTHIDMLKVMKNLLSTHPSGRV